MGSDDKRKLQIRVKKWVDHCPIEPHKGDVLHVHYMGKLEDETELDSSLPQPGHQKLGTGDAGDV
jgi:FKBP-type peptidyl-prolyl cis-trans isomerase